MVVNGLNDFIFHKCPSSVKTIPICPSPGTKYLVDGCSFINTIVRQTTWVFGGQWKELKERIEKTVAGLLAEGCEGLIFVVPHDEDKVSVGDLERVRLGLEYIAEHTKLPPSVEFYQVPVGVYLFLGQVLRTSCPNVEVIASVEDYEWEVAAWAKARGCTGLLTDNLEYIVMNTAPCHLLSSLNLESHTVTTIDRALLTKHVGLRETNLPLLSCLLGNAQIPPTRLTSFHRKLSSGLTTGAVKLNPVLEILPRICMYVRPHTPQFPMLARTVLGDSDRAEELAGVVGRYSLAGVDEAWRPGSELSEASLYPAQIYADVCEKERRCEAVPFVRSLLHSYTYEQGCTVEHRPPTPAIDLYMPLRQACYSVVLGPDASVTEKCAGRASRSVPCRQLRERVNLVEARKRPWEVFVEVAGVTFSAAVARELPPQFLGLCAILNYWYHSDLMDLQLWEVDALIAQAVSQWAKDVPSVQRILVTVVNARAITLSALFARGVEALLQAASVTGLPLEPLLPHHYFDGRLFSFYYYLASQGSTAEQLCDSDPERVELFAFLKMVVKERELSFKTEQKKEEPPQQPRRSIVPEYEGFSDSDSEGEGEVVRSGEGEGEVRNGEDTQMEMARNGGGTNGVEVEPVSDSEEEEGGASPNDAVFRSESSSPGTTAPLTPEEEEGVGEFRYRQDSTGSAVFEMARLAMQQGTAPLYPSATIRTKRLSDKENLMTNGARDHSSPHVKRTKSVAD